MSAPPPIPQVPPDWPGPMGVLPYSHHMHRGRPGVVTAIGVISIVLAVLSALANVWIVAASGMFYMMPRMIGAATPPVAVTAPPPRPTPGGGATVPTPPTGGNASAGSTSVLTVGPRGLGPNERSAVTEVLNNRRPLSAAQLANLDMLLAESGADVIAGTGIDVSAEQLRWQVRRDGVLPETDRDFPGATFFDLPGGRLRVNDDVASFRPNDGSAPLEASTTGSATAAGVGQQSTGTALTSQQVQTVVARAQTVAASSGKTLTPQQVKALQTLLATPTQQLVGPTEAAADVVPYAVMDAGNGAVTLYFFGGTATLDPRGTVTSMAITPVGAGGFATGATAGGPNPFAVFSGISSVSVVMVMVAGGLGLALAVFLFVAGILTLRQSARGRKLHLIWAWLKIPVELMLAIGFAWLMAGMIRGVFTMTGPGGGGAVPAPPTLPVMSAVTPQALFSLAVGCAYPIALLIALNTRKMRDYYAYLANPEATSP